MRCYERARGRLNCPPARTENCDASVARTGGLNRPQRPSFVFHIKVVEHRRAPVDQIYWPSFRSIPLTSQSSIGSQSRLNASDFLMGCTTRFGMKLVKGSFSAPVEEYEYRRWRLKPFFSAGKQLAGLSSCGHVLGTSTSLTASKGIAPSRQCDGTKRSIHPFIPLETSMHRKFVPHATTFAFLSLATIMLVLVLPSGGELVAASPGASAPIASSA